jgi:hypothetical protein
MKARHLQIETETRDGKAIYFSYVDGRYFEHKTREEVVEHLLVAAEIAERYADFYARRKADPEYQFLWEFIFHGLEDFNSGFDSPLIPHFSPDDFAIVIERCAKHDVCIIGIEVFDIGSWPISLLDICDGRYARHLVKSYRNQTGISFCGCFDVGENVPGGKKFEFSEDLIDLEEALGGKRGPDNCTGSV